MGSRAREAMNEIVLATVKRVATCACRVCTISKQSRGYSRSKIRSKQLVLPMYRA